MKNYHFALADYQQALDLDSDDWDIKSRISRQYIERKFWGNQTVVFQGTPAQIYFRLIN